MCQSAYGGKACLLTRPTLSSLTHPHVPGPPCATQVIAHARWHADHTDLDMRKRVALVTWREERERSRRLAAAHAEVLAAGGTAGARPRTAGAQVGQQRAITKVATVGRAITWRGM
jgi:hypothetical protein